MTSPPKCKDANLNYLSNTIVPGRTSASKQSKVCNKRRYQCAQRHLAFPQTRQRCVYHTRRGSRAKKMLPTTANGLGRRSHAKKAVSTLSTYLRRLIKPQQMDFEQVFLSRADLFVKEGLRSLCRSRPRISTECSILAVQSHLAVLQVKEAQNLPALSQVHLLVDASAVHFSKDSVRVLEAQQLVPYCWCTKAT